MKKLITMFVVTAISLSLFGQKKFVPNITKNFKSQSETFSNLRIHNGSVYADFSEQKTTAQQVESQLNTLLKLNSDFSFVQISQENDELGFTHTHLQQFYKNIAIDGQMIMLHEKDGFLKSINGNFARFQNIDLTVQISDNQAVEAAKQNLNVTQLSKEFPVETVVVKLTQKNETTFALAKKVRIQSWKPLTRYDVFVDAATGEILKKISKICTADANGTGQTLFSGTQTFKTNSYAGGYRLHDIGRKIYTYDGANWDSNSYPTTSQLFTNATTTWAQHASLDVHWGMEKTYDYYLNVFNRHSYDNSSSNIINIYNPVVWDDDDMQYNAAWLGDWGNGGMMVYGRGGNTYGYNSVVGLDVQGHELTHGVTEYSANLYYYGESGALNESFSDIFATCIEFYSNVNPDWTIGEDVVSPFMRSMSNPSTTALPSYYRQPDTYLGNYWDYDEEVHTNSGVQNFWFYLLCQGGTGTNDNGDNYSVTGIGITNAAKIAYRNLTVYLTPFSSYIDSYNGSLQAAADLFGNPSAQYTAVQNAWYAVGIDGTITPPTPENNCETGISLTEPSGTFNDGSGAENYADNQWCMWIISPPCATSVTLTFTEFETEANYDVVYIVDGTSSDPQASYSGTTLPAAFTSNTGVIIIYFISDGSYNYGGFTATYTSTGSQITCSGITTLTELSGTFSDGSGNNEYCNGLDCYWLIAPQSAGSIQLTFSQFDIEPKYGATFYDYVAVYNGETTNSPRLGTFAGNAIPSALTATSGKMLVHFFSDVFVNGQGFTANYTTTQSAVDRVEESKVAVFPNPAKSVLNIQFADNQNDVKLELCDMLGKTIKIYALQNISANSVETLNIDDVPNGIYNLRLFSEKKSESIKVIVSR